MATILTKKKDTTGAPATGDLTNSSGGAELAVNTADKRLYTKNSSNAVVEIGTNPGTAVTFVAGTASDPAITTTGDTNTGIFFPAADTIAFAEGGVEAMRIDSSGNVGIGTSSPTQKLQVESGALLLQANNGTTSPTAVNRIIFNDTDTTTQPGQEQGVIEWFENDGGDQTSTAFIKSVAESTSGGGALVLGTGAVLTNATERMRIDSSGNVLIGTTTASAKLYVEASSGGLFKAYNAGVAQISIGHTGGSVNYYDGDLQIFRSGAGTERMRIDSSGKVLFGTTSTNPTSGGAMLEGDSGFFILSRSGTGGETAIRFNRNGSTVGSITTTGSATAYNTSSDYRLKENIALMTGALAKVLELKPVTYTWKIDGSAGQGFIAHELAEVCPDAVTGEKDATEIRQVEGSPAVYEDVVIPAVLDEDGNEVEPERTENRLVSEAVMEDREFPVYQGVDTSFLVATLTAAIQELSAKNDALEARLAALEAK